jgi:hypothetical protein
LFYTTPHLLSQQIQNLFFMKKHLLFIILFISSFTSINFCYAQGVAVNTDGSIADPSAILDVKSTGQGVLVPRMALSDRTLITSPATGLLIYQTDNTPGFYYNAGTPGTPNWTLLGATGAAGPNGPTGAGFVNGSSAGQIYLTGISPFAPQAPQTVTGDVTISSTAVTSYNNIVPTNKGGAGNVNGILSANGAGTVSAASTTGSGNVVLSTSPTLVTPSLGTPSALVGTNISGTAANLTAGNVTTDANLTGDVTSSGNATTIANSNIGGNHIASALQLASSGITGAGNVVLATFPTLVAPALGTPSALVGTNISGTAANLTAGNVTTDANLTGAITSVGNATSYNTIVPIAKGGTGTGTTPSLVGGTNVTVTGTWPNQTIATTSNISSAAISNTITSTTSTYFVTDGVALTLPAATTIGQVIILMDTNPGTGFTGSGFSVSRTGSDTITDNINTGTTGLTSLSGQFLLRFVSDGAHHWYIF